MDGKPDATVEVGPIKTKVAHVKVADVTQGDGQDLAKGEKVKK
jgi:hypothetical protein